MRAHGLEGEGVASEVASRNTFSFYRRHPSTPDIKNGNRIPNYLRGVGLETVPTRLIGMPHKRDPAENY